MELETDTRASLEFLPARQRHGFPSDIVETTTASRVVLERLPEVPRCSPSATLLTDILTHGALCEVTRCESSVSEDPKTPAPRFAFQVKKTSRPFTFQRQNRTPPRGVKRRRQVQDVDGPYTADCCCKKRRLRADLITSRLSQPFSQPATHILNREGAESGDKRFLKMATSVDAVRRIAHLHATSFLRFSVMNRVRKRLAAMKPLLQQRMAMGYQLPPGQPREVEATAKAPWEPPTLQTATRATYWQPSSAIGAGSSSPALAPQQGSKLSPPVPRVSKPTALPLPASDLAATKERTAPRIHSVPSPELRPDPLPIDDTEEDSFAFLHPDFDDCGDDDPEHVYSDFGAIFRPGSPDAQASDDHSYEEYLDELDGISWVMG